MSSDAVEVSPLQMKLLLFEEVHVRALHSPDKAGEHRAPGFRFHDTPIVMDVQLAEKPAGSENEGTNEYRVSVVLRVDEDSEVEHLPPYGIRVAANAWFEVMPEFPQERRRTLVEVNGTSMIIGAIREEVARVTSRCHLGTLTLPTLRVVPNREGQEDGSALNTK